MTNFQSNGCFDKASMPWSNDRYINTSTNAWRATYNLSVTIKALHIRDSPQTKEEDEEESM